MVLPVIFITAEIQAQCAADDFNPGTNNFVYTMAVQPDGKIVIGGAFPTLGDGVPGSVTRNRIARLNPDGTLDTSFNPGASGDVYSMAIQADGKILAAGSFTSIGGQTRNRIARREDVAQLSLHLRPDILSTPDYLLAKSISLRAPFS